MNFFFALIVATASFVGGSLLWPRLTTKPAPSAVQQVRKAVVQTQLGKQAADVLGVSDEKNVQPINIGKTLNDAVNVGEHAVEERIQFVIVENALNQLLSQMNKLPKDQQNQIRQEICSPPAKQ